MKTSESTSILHHPSESTAHRGRQQGQKTKPDPTHTTQKAPPREAGSAFVISRYEPSERISLNLGTSDLAVKGLGLVLILGGVVVPGEHGKDDDADMATFTGKIARG